MSSAVFEEGLWDLDSGYVSAATPPPPKKEPELGFSKEQVKFLNSQLQRLEPQDILRWCIISLPHLHQETALGLTGSVILDMLSKITWPVPPAIDTIFIDTLYHFDETLALLDQIKARYGGSTTFHVYKPAGVNTTKEFEDKYGKNLWSSNSERYDYLAKVEPTERAYSELDVKAVITGRRKTQGGSRSTLDILEISDEGIIKVNPLANWSFEQVNSYVHENGLPYNSLLDMGYKSIGDWHSTMPVVDGEDERAGRWKGTEKTECGIHNPQSRYAQYLLEKEREDKKKQLDDALRSSFVVRA